MITDLCFFAINKSLGIHCESPARRVGGVRCCASGTREALRLRRSHAAARIRRPAPEESACMQHTCWELCDARRAILGMGKRGVRWSQLWDVCSVISPGQRRCAMPSLACLVQTVL